MVIYEHMREIPELLDKKLITRRKHPTLPLWVHNYTAGAQALPIKDWTPALKDCRGLILDYHNEVIGRPFAKFWNYEQVLDQIPEGPFTVTEKLDGSLGIVCNYRGHLVVATRGSFESEQAKFAYKWLTTKTNCDGTLAWIPAEGLTYLFEILYPENRIVVDYGDTRELRLLAVMEANGQDSLSTFHANKWFKKARSFASGVLFSQDAFNQDRTFAPFETPGEEGYVICWYGGFRAKVKFAEYCRLHRLITQVSTRTIWEMLRAGEGEKIKEMTERVPENFKSWVYDTLNNLIKDYNDIRAQADMCFAERPGGYEDRGKYAAWVKTQPANFGLLFALYDGKPIEDRIWKMVEPIWATPFHGEAEG